MPIPGPPALGRGVVVLADDDVPTAWSGAPVIEVHGTADEVAALHEAWAARRPVVVRLRRPGHVPGPGVDRPGAVAARRPASSCGSTASTSSCGPTPTTPGAASSRCGGGPARRPRLGATETPDGPGDVALPDGTPAWIDGGPRGPLDPADRPPRPPSCTARRSSSGRLDAAARRRRRRSPPTLRAPTSSPPSPTAPARPASSPPPARARPACSPSGCATSSSTAALERERVLAVAYNKKAQLEMEAAHHRLPAPRQHAQRPRLPPAGRRHGRAPACSTSATCAASSTTSCPPAATGPTPTRSRPYLEGLTAIRLGLRDPEEVEAERDDVPGLAAAFGPYRQALRRRGRGRLRRADLRRHRGAA